MGIAPAGDELLRVVEVRHGEADLTDVVDTRVAATGFAGRLDGRQQHADERADDGDDDEQFDEREAGPAALNVGAHWKPFWWEKTLWRELLPG